MGVTAAALRTSHGREAVVRTVLAAANRALTGSLTVGQVGGSFLAGLVVRNVVIRERDGTILAEIPRVQLEYGLRDILGGSIVLGRMELTAPRISLVKRPGRRTNLEEVLGLGGTGDHGPTPLIAFRDVRISDGLLEIRTPAERRDSTRAELEAGPEGYVRVRRVSGLNAELPYLRVTSPLPNEDGVRIDIAALDASVSDPSLSAVNVRGRVEVRGDTIHLALTDAVLPASRAAVNGSVALAPEGLELDLRIDAESVSTDDVVGLISEVPKGLVGSGLVRVRDIPNDALYFELDDFTAEGSGGGGGARGRLSMVVGPGDQWRFQDTGLDLDDFDLEYIRAFFDTLPVAGRATGRFESDGPKQNMTMRMNVAFRDSLVEGWPVSTIDASGTMAVGVPGDIVFREYAVNSADLDLGTVRRILPGVDLQGRLSASGVLTGPWLQVEFTGSLQHVDAPHPPTDAHGIVRVDARRDTLGVWSDLQFDSLSLDGLRTSYPQLIDVSGTYAGRIVLAGYLDSAVLEANLEGAAGAVFADGVVTLLAERSGFPELDLRMARLDLNRINSSLPKTDLFGRVRGSGMVDSTSGSWAHANAVLRASSLEGVTVDSIAVSLAATESAIRLDTLEVWGRRLRLSGTGSVGTAAGLPGTVTLTAANDSIAAIEPLLEALFGELSPQFRYVGQPWGSIGLNVTVSGTLRDYAVAGQLDVRNLQRGHLYASVLTADGTWYGPSNTLDLTAAIDSIEIGRWKFADVEATVEGPVDSIEWFARTRFGPDGLGAMIGEGRLIAGGNGERMVPIERMGFLLASGAWFVDTTSTMQFGDSGLDLRRFTLASDVNAGRVVLDGRLPVLGSGGLEASVEALPIVDLWSLLQWDYRDVGGELGATFSLSGTRDNPKMELSAGMVTGRFGRFQVPQALAKLAYEDKRVTGQVNLLRMGEEILDVEVRLPLDLSLRRMDQRTLSGPILVLAAADGVDLSFLEAVTPLVRQASGTLDADFGLTGTWENPQLTGTISFVDGAGTYPGIGVRHENVNGSFRLAGDTVRIEHLSVTSGRGSAQVSGFVRLEELSRPILNLHMEADEFRGLDLRDFLTLTASGTLDLSGPVFGATASGRGTVTSGVLYYADLVTKDIINIEDTLYSEFVDPTLIRREGLGVAFQNRFLDSLRVDGLRLRMGSDVWMRSAEANIQLLGEVTVNKVRRQYRLNGTLETPRGVYRVTPGPSLVQLVATRDFTVTRGEVTYLGTPDLNAAVDIEARHRVRSVRGEEVAVTVHIGGTVYEPRLTFTSDIHPPISETEILSYLFFGAPSVAALSGTGNLADQRLAEQGLNQFLGAVSGQLEYSLISDFKVPLDYVQIRPTGLGGDIPGLDVAVGKRLGENWFVTVNPRYCKRAEATPFEALRVGASLEYRLSREWMVLLSGDPVQSCSAFSAPGFAERYQLGLDLFWEKRY